MDLYNNFKKYDELIHVDPKDTVIYNSYILPSLTSVIPRIRSNVKDVSNHFNFRFGGRFGGVADSVVLMNTVYNNMVVEIENRIEQAVSDVKNIRENGRGNDYEEFKSQVTIFMEEGGDMSEFSIIFGDFDIFTIYNDINTLSDNYNRIIDLFEELYRNKNFNEVLGSLMTRIAPKLEDIFAYLNKDESFEFQKNFKFYDINSDLNFEFYEVVEARDIKSIYDINSDEESYYWDGLELDMFSDSDEWDGLELDMFSDSDEYDRRGDQDHSHVRINN